MASNQQNDPLSVQLLVNGASNDAIILKIQVDKRTNNIAQATIVLNDGSRAQDDFKLCDSTDFNPGNEIEIKAGYHSKEKTIFKGIIMSQTIEIDVEEGPSLHLKCADKAIKSTIVHQNQLFQSKTDSEIIKSILGNYQNALDVDSTQHTYDELIQFGSTDWDFVLQRAALNGMVVTTDDGKTSVKSPAVNGKPVASLTYGDNIIEMKLSLDSSNQLKTVTSESWDSSNQNIISGNSKEPSVNKQGSISGKKLADVMNVDEQLQSATSMDKELLETVSNSTLLRSRLSRFQGTITCEGNAAIKPNTLIELSGVAKKFNGNVYVSGVSHELEEGRWLMEITVGMTSQFESIEEKSLINNLTVNGLQIGVVKKVADDPDGEFRVQVHLPLINSNDGIWARLSSFYASNGSGAFFYPEIDDEVILGFLDDDASSPIILGSMYSKNRAPALVPDEQNSHKGIFTRSKMKIDFNEVDKSISIETPGGNKIILDDTQRSILVTDQNKNQLIMDPSGVTINSAKDLVLKATNDVSIEGINVSLKASSDLDMTSNNTTSKANMSYSAQGGASAEIKSSGNLTIKGAMVDIN